MSKITRYYGNDLFIEGTYKPGALRDKGYYMRDSRHKPVLVKTKDGKELAWFPSVEAAAQNARVSTNTMYSRIRSQAVVNGHIWVYE